MLSYSRMIHTSNNGSFIDQRYRRGIYLLFLLFLLYSLYTFFGGDDSRYEFFVTEDYLDTSKDFKGIEPLYVTIASITGGHFLLWKLIVYGASLLLTFIVLRRTGSLNYTALCAFTVSALASYGSTRGVLAYSAFLLAIVLLGEETIMHKLVGAVLAVLSISAHSSMILPVFLIPLVFFFF